MRQKIVFSEVYGWIARALENRRFTSIFTPSSSVASESCAIRNPAEFHRADGLLSLELAVLLKWRAFDQDVDIFGSCENWCY